MEAHLSIKKVQKYYTLVHYAYNIIQVETQSIISKNAILQMLFKAINNIAGPNSLVLSLFVFSAYPCIIIDSSL